MKLCIGAFLCLAGGAAAFVQQPTRTASTQQTKLAMASEPKMDDRRSFVTKVSFCGSVGFYGYWKFSKLLSLHVNGRPHTLD